MARHVRHADYVTVLRRRHGMTLSPYSVDPNGYGVDVRYSI